MNEYRILEKMATGSFGVIFKVRRVADNAIFVMKRIALTDLDEKQRQEAAQEIRVMSRLHHPFVVAQRDAFIFNSDSLCIVMDYYDGGDLDALITRQREKDEYLPMDLVMTWFASMCLAIQYLHTEGIVHRDLKTHNVFLDLQTKEVAIGDFGVAEFLDASPSSQQGFMKQGNGESYTDGLPSRSLSSSSFRAGGRSNSNSNSIPTAAAAAAAAANGGNGVNGIIGGGGVRGTLLYMAPEALENGVSSPSSDIWSLGCILYELLSLRHPFESRDIAGLMVRVLAGAREPLPAHYPAEVRELIDRMLALDPRRRPSCEEILRSPAVCGYARKLTAQRVRNEAQDSPVVRTWEMQRRQFIMKSNGKGNASNNNNGGGDSINSNRDDNSIPLPQATQPLVPPSQERETAEMQAKRVVVPTPQSDVPLSPGSPIFREDGCPSRVQLLSPLKPRGDDSNSLSSFLVGHGSPTLRDAKGDGNENYTLGNDPLHHSIPSYPDNVEDMRYKPLSCIEEEVMRYRQLVQSEMRAQKQQRDAAMLKKKFDIDVTVPTPYRASGVYVGKSPTEVTTPELLLASQILAKSTPLSNPLNTRVQASGSGITTGESSPYEYLETSLVEKRRNSIHSAIQVLGGDTFLTVYNYYKAVEVANRDVARVMQMVPDRSQWPILPVVEDVIVIERLLEQLKVATSSP
ncbi:Protein kinase domain [Trypanosoma melophagium]|uniref:Protein kinase domain n=1 Tax=Trypanosoma melophagium TaxID=715481 RepID=UPI00351A257E|nr:Protein kinase domain [Trypanosoma melophagium]